MAKKQAKALSGSDELKVLKRIEETRYPVRNKCMFLLSVKTGLRAMEISRLKWWMLVEEDGEIKTEIIIPSEITKDEKGGREIEIGNTLVKSIKEHYDTNFTRLDRPVFISERGLQMSSNIMCQWFMKIYKSIKLFRCSSHSGRRTFITNSARTISLHGGSLYDVMYMAGHARLTTTQMYIEGNKEARRALADSL